VTDAAPTLRWAGDASRRHRVQVAIVLPEARVLDFHDAEVAGTSYQLPRPIASARAAVKVRVTRGCDAHDPQDLHAQGPAFFFDVRGACALDSPLQQDGSGLRWRPVPGASHYRVRLFGSVQGQDHLAPLSEDEVTAPAWAPRPNGPRAVVATVQPVCASYPGRAEAFTLR
jgi:hypothetical protein